MVVLHRCNRVHWGKFSCYTTGCVWITITPYTPYGAARYSIGDIRIVEKIRLEIAQITPGMKLAEPITNASGITLMPAGIRLTPMFIARIKKWNIGSLDVFVEKKQPDDESARPVQRSGTSIRTGRSRNGQAAEQEMTLTEEQEQFARSVASEVSRAFVNMRNNPLMMMMRAVTIKRLVMAGPDAAINLLRRGPQDKVPLPEENS